MQSIAIHFDVSRCFEFQLETVNLIKLEFKSR